MIYHNLLMVISVQYVDVKCYCHWLICDWGTWST